MTSVVKIRPFVFAFGIAGIFLSLSALVGGHFRTANTSVYLQQADEAVAFVKFGLLSATIGLIFFFFGWRWWRIVAVGLAFLLFVW